MNESLKNRDGGAERFMVRIILYVHLYFLNICRDTLIRRVVRGFEMRGVYNPGLCGSARTGMKAYPVDPVFKWVIGKSRPSGEHAVHRTQVFFIKNRLRQRIKLNGSTSADRVGDDCCGRYLLTPDKLSEQSAPRLMFDATGAWKIVGNTVHFNQSWKH